LQTEVNDKIQTLGCTVGRGLKGTQMLHVWRTDKWQPLPGTESQGINSTFTMCYLNPLFSYALPQHDH